MKSYTTPIVIVIIVLVVALALFYSLPVHKSVLNYNLQYYNSSVSSLLMSNWVNNSAFIYTGVPDKEIGLAGNASIYHILLPAYGLLHDKITFSGGNTTSAELNLYNQVRLNRTYSSDIITMPFNSSDIIIEQNSTSANDLTFTSPHDYSYSVKNNTAYLYGTPNITIFSKGSTFTVINKSNQTEVLIENPGNMGVELAFSSQIKPIQQLIAYNDKYISGWLDSSKNISLSGTFKNEYYLSLLLVKDDQNPITGEFAASPSPIYLYSWVRDSSFAAMAMQDSGHLNSAEKYWNWMSSMENSNGTWFTRYNFWTSAPDTSYGIPEYDSVGLFQIGVSNLLNITGNKSLVNTYLPYINRSILWEEKSIENDSLIPQDLSIWEDVMAYNFWTQAIDLVGMEQTKSSFGSAYPGSSLVNSISILNSSIQKDFYNGSFYAEYLYPSDEYVNEKLTTMLVPYTIADSSSILPIAYGLVNVDSNEAKSDINAMVGALTVNGGLARFTGDDYHYSTSLYDSSGPMPPWIITTLFLAYYYEKTGNYLGAYNEMSWALQHAQNGLLPEAVDPNYGNPLRTTSPLTWSSATYILTALNYK